MALELEKDYRLRLMDFDQHGRIQPWALLDLFQDMATLHAEDMGIGRASVVAEGVFWAIVRMKFEIVRQPRYPQKVVVRTWPHSLSRFSFIRDFAAYDEEGELLVKATSEWVLMDVVSRKFASVKDHYAGPTDFSEDRAFSKKPRKVANFEEEGEPTLTVVPTYCDIDVNGHVNNAMYARFVVNALNPSEQGYIHSFQIDFRHEAHVDEPLALYVDCSGDSILAKGVNAQGDTAFACALELEDTWLPGA